MIVVKYLRSSQRSFTRIMKLLYPEITESKRITARKFDNEFLIFKEDECRPIAHRSPNSEAYGNAESDDVETLFEFDRFHLYGNQKEICCKYRSRPALTSRLSLLDNTKSFGRQDIDGIVDYLSAAYNLDPYTIPRISAISAFENLVSRVANFCGCLTDIYREDTNDKDYNSFPDNKQNGSFIAVSLPIIALMYRRISALRGFNFKISFVDSLPCLGFSAKILIEKEKPKATDIPEYATLCELADSDKLIIAARLIKIAEEDSVDELYRLSVVICPQDIDPRGLLRAPVRLQQTQNIIDKFDFDIPGKY